MTFEIIFKGLIESGKIVDSDDGDEPLGTPPGWFVTPAARLVLEGYLLGAKQDRTSES